MVIDTSGNVGIGTTAPGQKLTIEGTAPIAEIRTGGYLMLRPTANDWDMRLQAVGMRLDVLSGGALGSPIMSFLNGGGANLNGRLTVVGNYGDWPALFNWGPGTSTGYGILVGSATGHYSQFQNQEGYYTLLAYTSWGIYSNGNIGGANFYYVSDRRLKTEIKTSPGLELISKLRGVSFNWKKDGTKSDGVIAQEIEAVMPEAVTANPEGFKTVKEPLNNPWIMAH